MNSTLLCTENCNLKFKPIQRRNGGICYVYVIYEFDLSVSFKAGMSGDEKYCWKLQFIEWPLEAWTNSESVPMESHVKMSNFKTDINMFTA